MFIVALFLFDQYKITSRLYNRNDILNSGIYKIKWNDCNYIVCYYHNCFPSAGNSIFIDERSDNERDSLRARIRSEFVETVSRLLAVWTRPRHPDPTSESAVLCARLSDTGRLRVIKQTRNRIGSVWPTLT